MADDLGDTIVLGSPSSSGDELRGWNGAAYNTGAELIP
jgi:hypothetical protein